MTDSIILGVCGFVIVFALLLFVISKIQEARDYKRDKEKEDLRKAIIEGKLWSDELESLDLSDEDYKYYRN